MRDRAARCRFGKRSRRLLSVLMPFAVLPTIVACGSMSPWAESPPLIARHPLDEPGAPQAVAVLVSLDAPKASLRVPFQSRTEAAAQGGAAGAAVGALSVFMLAPLALLAGPAGVLALPAIMGGGAAVGLAAGAATGMESVVPKDEAAAIERLASEAIGQLRLPELTAEAVAGGVKKLTHLDAAIVDHEVGADSDAYRALRERGFGSAIAIKVKEVGFDRWGIKPVMALVMTAEARLIDTATGKPTVLRALLYVSPRREGRVWAQDDAALTRAEIERAYRTLAERIIDDLVLRADGGIARLGVAPEDFRLPDGVCYLVPHHPEPEWKGFFERQHLAESKAESVTPLLAWGPAPAADWSAGNAPWANARESDVTYDLRIWSVVDDEPGKIVYEREGLAQREHRVEQALQPDSKYFWSVRMRYVVDGRAGATPWAAADIPKTFLHASLRDELAYAYFDGSTLKPVACSAADMTPCRCLDFIPAPNYFRFRTP